MSSVDDDTGTGPGAETGAPGSPRDRSGSKRRSSGNRSSRRRRAWWRRALRAALVIGLSIGLLLAALLLAASIYFDDDRVRELLVGLLDDNLQGSFEIEEVSLSIRSASIRARGLRVLDPTGEEVLRARSLEAAIEPTSLLRDEVRIRRLVVDGANVRLVPPSPSGDPDPSSFSLIDAFASTAPPADADDPPGAAWTVRILDLSLTDLGLHMDTGEGIEVDVGGGEVMDGRLSYDESGIGLTLDGAFERIKVAVDDLTFDLASVSADRVSLSYGPGAEGGVELGTITAIYAAKEPPVGPITAREGNVRLTGRVLGLGEEMVTDELVLEVDLVGTLDLEAAAIRSYLPDELAASLSPQGLAKVEAQLRGTAGEPRVTGSIASNELVVIGEPLTRLNTRFAWGAGVLNLDDLELVLPDGRVEGRVRIDLTGDVDLVWSAALNARDLPAKRLFAAYQGASGADGEESGRLPIPERISGPIDAAGRSGDSLSGRATLDLIAGGLPDDLVAGLPDSLRFRGTAHFDDDWLRLEPMRATGAGLDLDANGRVPLGEGGSLDLTLRVRHARPKDLFSAYELPLDARSLVLSARLTGSFDRPKVEGTLVLDAARMEDYPAADLLVPFSFLEGTIQLLDARAGVAGGEVLVRGSVDVLTPDLEVLDDPRYSLNLRVARVRMDTFSEGHASGRLSFVGRADGSLSSPRAAGELEIEGLEILGVPFATAEARIGVDGDRVVAEHFELVPAEGGRLEGSGGLGFSDMAIELTMAARDLPLTLAAGLTEEPLPLSGRVDLDLSVGGNIEEPSFTAAATGSGLRYEAVALGSLEAEIEGSLSRIELRVGLENEAGRLDAAGWVSLEDETLEVALNSQRLRVEDLPFVADLGQEVAGRVFVDLTVGGSFSSPEILGRILARTLEFDGERFGDGRVDVQVRPLGMGAHAMTVDLLGASRLDVEVRLDPVLSVSAEGGLDGLSLAWLVPSLVEHELDAILTGRLNASWVTDGELEARVDLDSLSVKVSSEVLTSRRPMSLAWDNERLVIDGLSLQGPNGTFEAFGEIGDTIDLTAKGNLEMELLAPFIADIALATGTVEIDLKALGDSDSPRITGDIAISKPLRLRPRRMIREIEIASGRARFEPGKLVVERLSGNVHGGMFRASGEVELDGLDPKSYRFLFTGQELPLRTESLLLEANADVTLTGADGRSKVSGRVEVVRGRYMEKFELDRFSFRRARKVVNEPLAQRVPMLNDIDLELRVVSLGAMEILADAGAFSLDMVLDADLEVTGTAAEPILNGRVEASRGGLEFPRARLDVARSNIEFVPRPGEAIRPRIDLRAEGEVTPASAGETGQTTYFITLVLDGDLDEMVLDLTSDPSLDRLEILSLLVTGRRPADHLAGSAGTQADAAMVFAGSQLAEPLTRFVTQQLESYLNLELELSAEVTSAGLLLVAGKEVTRRLRFEWAFQRAFAGDQAASSAARARYLISDRIFIEGTTESVMGQGTASAGAREGARSRLELKLRIYGQ